MKASSIPIESVPRIFQFARDPGDEPYINLAVAGHTQYLVTRDRDLLDLTGEATPEGRELRRVRPGLKILDPLMFLRELAAAGEYKA